MQWGVNFMLYLLSSKLSIPNIKGTMLMSLLFLLLIQNGKERNVTSNVGAKFSSANHVTVIANCAYALVKSDIIKLSLFQDNDDGMDLEGECNSDTPILISQSIVQFPRSALALTSQKEALPLISFKLSSIKSHRRQLHPMNKLLACSLIRN